MDVPKQVQVFQEEDYRYGTGALTMRVEKIAWNNPDRYDGENWYFVEGVQLTRTGAELGPRTLLVRAKRLQL